MGRIRALVTTAAVVALGASLLATPAVAADDPPVTVVSRPTITGTARYGSVLTASPGGFDPSDATTSITWLRDGRDTGKTGTRYELTVPDHGHRISVRVTASATGRSDVVSDSTPTAPVRWKELVATKAPTISGVRRFGHVLTARPGSWKDGTPRIAYRWLRDGRSIAGATSRRYRIQPADVGHKLSFRLGATRKHYSPKRLYSPATAVIRHRRDVRATVTYSVVSDGASSSLAVFARDAAQTYADARGWRGAGVQLRRVSRGGSFTLVLAKASRVPRYSSECSASYSCRVGRYVIINEARWNGTTRTWRAAHRSQRDYRHMVVNHETGHWFGKLHATCGGAGQLAPVMQQQSKGLHGCRTNPWPQPSELGLPRFGWGP